MSGKTPELFSYFKRKRCDLFILIQIFFRGKKEKGEKHTSFTKRKMVFFSCTQFWFPFWCLCWSFPNLAAVAVRLLMGGLGSHASEIRPIAPGGGRFPDLSVAGCSWVHELRYLFFRCSAMRNFSGRLNKRGNPGYATLGSTYQNHICSLRPKLLEMDRF